MKHRLPIAIVLLGLLLPLCAWAQGDENEIPLGDVARAVRKEKQFPQHATIDNDNFSQFMDDAESRRMKGLLFSFDSLGKSIQVSAPDISCSLSFNAKTASLIGDPFIVRNLPDEEMPKLDGPATIEGDDLQVAVFNGTGWDLKEITLGLTIVRGPEMNAASYGEAKLVPAAVGSSEPALKRSDTTVLYHIPGTAAPFSNTVFHAPLGLTLSPDQEWHWAIVAARGIPPKAN
jgi:hypothetical protein